MRILRVFSGSSLRLPIPLEVLEEGDGFFDLFFRRLGVEAGKGVAGEVAAVLLDNEAFLFDF